MRVRLLLLTAFTSALVLIVMIVAVAPLVRTQVTDQFDQGMRTEVLDVSRYIIRTSPTDEALASYLNGVNRAPGTSIGIRTADLDFIGEGAAGLAQRWPTTIKLDPNPAQSVLVRLDPRIYTSTDGDRIASQGVFTGNADWIVEATTPRSLIAGEQQKHWILISAAATVALLLALGAADILARRIIRPLKSAVHATESIGQGHLQAEVPTSGPREVVDLGAALNQLSARIDRLLTGERERAANLSHRLRTPLTVLSLETQRLEHELPDRPDQIRRVRQTISELEKGLDDVINDSRRTREDGINDRADAAEILRAHFEFWSTLAEDQGREATLDSPVDGLVVTMSAVQLATALDALFSNIFRHTLPGTDYQARLYRKNSRAAVLELANGSSNPAWDKPPAAASGSTGIGLKLAAQAIEAAGGSLTTSVPPVGGMLVTIDLRLAAATVLPG